MISIFFIITLINNGSLPNCSCDTVQDARSKIYYSKYVSSAPCFPGGIGKFQDYLIRHATRKLTDEKMSYPIEFFIKRDGTITNARIIGGTHSTFADSSMVKIILSMPKWIPAQCDGKPVVSRFVYRMSF